MEDLLKYYADLQYASYDAFNEWALCVISLLLILANEVVTVFYNYNYSIQFNSSHYLYCIKNRWPEGQDYYDKKIN